MSANETDQSNNKGVTWRLATNFLVELILYCVLVVGYALFVLRVLGDFLTRLFNNDLVVYAFIGLGLIVAQGVVLDVVTTLLLNWLRLERLE